MLMAQAYAQETTMEPETTAAETETTAMETETTMGEETTLGTTLGTTEGEGYCWEKSAISRSSNDITCTLCTFIFQIFDDVLTENEGNIADALAALCSYVPSQSVAALCEDLLEKCTDSIIETIIDSGFNPEDICNGIYLCP